MADAVKKNQRVTEDLAGLGDQFAPPVTEPSTDLNLDILRPQHADAVLKHIDALLHVGDRKPPAEVQCSGHELKVNTPSTCLY